MKIIIDSHGLGYTSINLALSHGGKATGLVFGFLSRIREFAEKLGSNQFIFCWDSKQSYREEIDPEYKKRDLPEDMKEVFAQAREQLVLLRDEILPTLGFQNIFFQPGYEADDLIATLVARFPDCYTIVTGDDDLLQLLREGRGTYTRIYNLPQKKIITAADFTSLYGIKPFDWIKVKAMGGCTSDNVKGIRGVGKDSAIKYLNGCLKQKHILEKIESDEGQEQMRFAWDLVALPFNGDRDIKMPEELAEDKFYSLNFMDVFRKYGCASFTNEEGFGKWRKTFSLISGR